MTTNTNNIAVNNVVANLKINGKTLEYWASKGELGYEIVEEERTVIAYEHVTRQSEVLEAIIMKPTKNMLDCVPLFECNVVKTSVIVVKLHLEEEDALYRSSTEFEYSGEEMVVIGTPAGMYWHQTYNNCVNNEWAVVAQNEDGSDHFCGRFPTHIDVPKRKFSVRYRALGDCTVVFKDGVFIADPKYVKNHVRSTDDMRLAIGSRVVTLDVFSVTGPNGIIGAGFQFATPLGNFSFDHIAPFEVESIPTPEQCGYSGEIDEDGNVIGEPLEWDEICP
jgi:hypothetical protein